MIFRSTSPAKLAAQQLQEARLALMEHEAAAEFNGAMAHMLRERIARLSQVEADRVPFPPHLINKPTPGGFNK